MSAGYDKSKDRRSASGNVVSGNIIRSFLGHKHSQDFIFWIIYLIILFISAQRFMRESNIYGFMIHESVKLVFLIAGLTLNNHILVPLVLRKQKGGIYTLLLTVMLLALSYGEMTAISGLHIRFP